MAQQKKTLCKYGAKCYRKNKTHFEEYSHPEDVQESEPPKKKQKPTEEPKPGTTKKKTISDFFGSNGKDKDDDEAQESSATQKAEGSKDDDQSKSAAKNDSPLDDAPESPQDMKENIKQKFLMDMPEDFYAFWEFAKSVHSSNPNIAFEKTLGLELVGPFDILGGRHKKSSRKHPCYLRHWRYYYDPPEFMTVARGDPTTHFHLGYFRDDPNEMPVFVASNAAASSCTIVPRGENLFAAFSWFIDDYIKKNKSKKQTLTALQGDLAAFAKKGGFSLEQKTKAMRARDKKVNCKLFHNAGMVVPVDEHDVGYREVPETTADLKKMFKKVVDADTEKERDAAFDPIMELIMLIQFANDECDYGEGLELGLDMFSYGGDVFKSNILNLAGLAYQLLGRHEYKQILEAHMENRSKSTKPSELD